MSQKNQGRKCYLGNNIRAFHVKHRIFMDVNVVEFFLSFSEKSLVNSGVNEKREWIEIIHPNIP